MTAAVKDIEEIVREHPFFAGLRRTLPQAGQRLRQERALRGRRIPVPRGRPGRPVLSAPPRPGGAGDRRPGAARSTFQTLSEGEIVGVSWLVRPTAGATTPRRIEFIRAIAMDAACLRDKMRGGPRSRLRDDEALHADPDPAAAGHPDADPGCLWLAWLDPTSRRAWTRPAIPWPRAWAACAAAGARRRTCGRSRSRRTALDGVRARPVQHADRLRRRRGADQPQRRPGRTRTAGPHRSARSAPSRGPWPSCGPASRSACADRSARAGRWPRRRARRGDPGRRAGPRAAAPGALSPAGRARALRPGRAALWRAQPRRHPVPPRAGGLAPAARHRYRGDGGPRRRRLARPCRAWSPR